MCSSVLTPDKQVSWGITLNVLTDRKACTITYLVSGTILSLLATMPRQLSKISWLAYVSFVSIFVAVIVTIVGVGIADEAHAGSSSAASVYDFAGEALHGSGAVSMRFWPKPGKYCSSFVPGQLLVW